MNMEVQEAEKVVIAKPVASRPAYSSFRSFSDLLAGAINAAPSDKCSETAVTAIRPRTMRFKPAGNHPAVGVFSSQADFPGVAVCSPYDKPDRKFNVVYKPMAKLVCRTTVPALSNMVSTHNGNNTVLLTSQLDSITVFVVLFSQQSANLFHKQESAELEALRQPDLVKHHTDLSSELHQNCLSPAEKDKRSEQSKMSSEILEKDHRSLSQTASGDRPSYDGYNWRKYGQKQVKGGEYPRSYYKCTHPNCPVKKKIERSLNGQIAEIVYKGEHNHSKPQPPKRNSSDEQRQGNVESNQPLWCDQQIENECHEGATGNQDEFGLSAHSSYSGRVPPFFDAAVGTTNCGSSPFHNSSCHREEFEEGTKGLEGKSDELISKRRKIEHPSNEACTSAKGTQEPQLLVQNAIDSTITRDGFRWRKYGQKVVKGNPYPRSYYRCTNLKCNVRKYVERTSDEPNAFITTYEGKHNHEMPTKRTNSAAAAKTSTKAVGN